MTHKKEGARHGAPTSKDTLTVPNNPVAVKSQAYHTRFIARAGVDFSDPEKAEAYFRHTIYNGRKSIEAVAQHIAWRFVVNEDVFSGPGESFELEAFEPFVAGEESETYVSESPRYGTITVKALQDIEPVRTQEVDQLGDAE